MTVNSGVQSARVANKRLSDSDRHVLECASTGQCASLIILHGESTAYPPLQLERPFGMSSNVKRARRRNRNANGMSLWPSRRERAHPPARCC